MTWFAFALVSTLGWGCADLFYKRSSDPQDRYSHLKIAVWVGAVMGLCALALLPLAEHSMSLAQLVRNAAAYAPASLCYIISMVIGYAGLRYLELSVVSPVQNASGAFSAVCMLVYFLVTGRVSAIGEVFSLLDQVATVLIVAGVIALAFAEQRLYREEKALSAEQKKYRFGASALLFPLLYCLFDTLGTAADGILLDGAGGLRLGEFDVIILYGLTFFAAGIVCWIALWILQKKPYCPFEAGWGNKAAAAVCEQFGQIFYVYAMAAKPLLAAPMIASYCIVSVILSRVFERERLGGMRFACVVTVIVGIVLFGISEGLAQ